MKTCGWKTKKMRVVDGNDLWRGRMETKCGKAGEKKQNDNMQHIQMTMLKER